MKWSHGRLNCFKAKIKFSQKQCKTILTKTALKTIPTKTGINCFHQKWSKMVLARIGINLFLPEMAYY